MTKNLAYLFLGGWVVAIAALLIPGQATAAVGLICGGVALGLFARIAFGGAFGPPPLSGRDMAGGWLPISTAPKDGRAIILCMATDADGKPITGKAFDVFVQIGQWWEGDGWVVYCSMIQDPNVHFEPTHWMPRPEPPEVV